jgi:hypothetical protein
MNKSRIMPLCQELRPIVPFDGKHEYGPEKSNSLHSGRSSSSLSPNKAMKVHFSMLCALTLKALYIIHSCHRAKHFYSKVLHHPGDD